MLREPYGGSKLTCRKARSSPFGASDGAPAASYAFSALPSHCALRLRAQPARPDRAAATPDARGSANPRPSSQREFGAGEGMFDRGGQVGRGDGAPVDEPDADLVNFYSLSFTLVERVEARAQSIGHDGGCDAGGRDHRNRARRIGTTRTGARRRDGRQAALGEVSPTAPEAEALQEDQGSVASSVWRCESVRERPRSGRSPAPPSPACVLARTSAAP